MSVRIGPGTRRYLGVLAGPSSGSPVGCHRPQAIFTTLAGTRGLFWGWLHFAGRLMPGGKLAAGRASW